MCSQAPTHNLAHWHCAHMSKADHLGNACANSVECDFFLTRPDETTAAERFFGQKPRSMCAAIFASVEIPPAPLSPPRRAIG